MFSHFRVQRRFAEMEDLLEVVKTLSEDRVQQRLGEQMMWKTLSGGAKRFWRLASASGLGSRRKRRRREEEEETEQMDLEEQPSRFQGHFRPKCCCASILRGCLCWRGSSCTFAHSFDELHPGV